MLHRNSYAVRKTPTETDQQFFLDLIGRGIRCKKDVYYKKNTTVFLLVRAGHEFTVTDVEYQTYGSGDQTFFRGFDVRCTYGRNECGIGDYASKRQFLTYFTVLDSKPEKKSQKISGSREKALR